MEKNGVLLFLLRPILVCGMNKQVNQLIVPSSSPSPAACVPSSSFLRAEGIQIQRILLLLSKVVTGVSRQITEARKVLLITG